MRAWCTIMILFLLSGCGGGTIRWWKPGVSSQQIQRDSFECKQMSVRPIIVGIGGGLLAGGTQIDQSALTECLQARGYTVTVEE